MAGNLHRYTTSYGLASYQLLKYNSVNGYDFPMIYGELYIPFVAEGMMIRLGAYISVPDIEAQLAPNNYMYTHSLTYGFDNYTNEGVRGSTVPTRPRISRCNSGLGRFGTEATVNDMPGTRSPIPIRTASLCQSPLYPGSRFLMRSGAPSSIIHLCAQLYLG